MEHHRLLGYDQVQDKITVKMDYNGGDIDSVTISPLGNYFLAFDDVNGMIVYDRDLKREIAVIPGVGHCDVALDSQNREVLVYQDTGTDNIAMADLETGKVTNLWPIDFTNVHNKGFHFFGCAFKQPGWVLVGCYGVAPNFLTWMDNNIFSMELNPIDVLCGWHIIIQFTLQM